MLGAGPGADDAPLPAGEPPAGVGLHLEAPDEDRVRDGQQPHERRPLDEGPQLRLRGGPAAPPLSPHPGDMGLTARLCALSKSGPSVFWSVGSNCDTLECVSGYLGVVQSSVRS